MGKDNTQNSVLTKNNKIPIYMSILFGTHFGEYTRLQLFILFMHVGGQGIEQQIYHVGTQEIGIAIDELLCAS